MSEIAKGIIVLSLMILISVVLLSIHVGKRWEEREDRSGLEINGKIASAIIFLIPFLQGHQREGLLFLYSTLGARNTNEELTI